MNDAEKRHSPHSTAQPYVQYFFCALFVALILACTLWLADTLRRGYSFDSSVMALLPEAKQSVGAARANQKLLDVADRRVVVLLQGVNKKTTREAAETFSSALSGSGLFASIAGDMRGVSTQSWSDFYWPWRYQLLAPTAAMRLQAVDHQSGENDTLLVDDALARLYSPLASMYAADLADDPLQLFSQWQLSLLSTNAFTVENGWLTRSVGEQHYRLIALELSKDPYDVDYQRQVLSALDQAANTLPNDVVRLQSGLMLHAAYGAERAKTEISSIGVGSLVGVLALLFYCFGRWRVVLIAIVPLLCGCIVALTASMLLFDKVNLITVAFGAGLVGVAIDYSLHYLCAELAPAAPVGLPTDVHRVQTFSPLRRILPGLCLGLLSSVLAYAAQAATPFPGLRQMAMFSVAGLIGAWLAVVCLLPVLISSPNSSSGIALNPKVLPWCRRLIARWPAVTSHKAVFAFLFLLALALFYSIAKGGTDDVRSLQTSPSSMLEADKRVRHIFAGMSLSGYYVVEGSSEQALLQREERLALRLQEKVDTGTLAGFDAVSRYVPSAAQQHRNNTLLRDNVYAEKGLLDDLVRRGQLQGLGTLARERFMTHRNSDGDIDAGAVLTVGTWLSADISRASRHLWLGEQDGTFYSMVSLSGVNNVSALTDVASLASDMDGVIFVDRPAEITALLTDYRRSLGRWLIVAYGVVLSMLLLRYGAVGWRVIAAPAMATVLTVCALHLFGYSFTLFHGLALLLILGIGIDASIFLHDSRNAAHTWLAVTLSSITTLLAFGLLAFSEIPILHYFGQTVAIGIVLVWLLSPCFVVPSRNDIGQE